MSARRGLIHRVFKDKMDASRWALRIMLSSERTALRWALGVLATWIIQIWYVKVAVLA